MIPMKLKYPIKIPMIPYCWWLSPHTLRASFTLNTLNIGAIESDAPSLQIGDAFSLSHCHLDRRGSRLEWSGRCPFVI